MTFGANGSESKCERCAKQAHLCWTTEAEKKRSLCLDCIDRATATKECSVCAEPCDSCITSDINGNAISTCARCIFNTCMYVQAMRNAAADLKTPETTSTPTSNEV
jgi:hypothetical protein